MTPSAEFICTEENPWNLFYKHRALELVRHPDAEITNEKTACNEWALFICPFCNAKFYAKVPILRHTL
jgi:hypothetical protein